MPSGVNLNTGLGPQARGWGPHGQSHKMKTVEAGGIRITVHEDVAELTALLINETVARGYELDHGAGDDWGYNDRLLTGSSSVWSNHAWGLADDLNARANPYQVNDGHMTTDVPGWMVKLWNEYGFRWGGDYQGEHKDPMHWEFMGTPADAKRLTDKARKELGGDMSFETFKDGIALRRQDKKLGDNADQDKKLGYWLADKALSGDEPSTGVGPHTHTQPAKTGPVS